MEINKKIEIITNNPLVKEKLENEYNVLFLEKSLRELFVYIRDQVHMGRRLLTHPLSGSVKPNETPYKTVMMSTEKGALDISSLEFIESAIATFDKLTPKYPVITEQMLEDFRLIDYTLIASALNSAPRQA